jgi:hypothetical protein
LRRRRLCIRYACTRPPALEVDPLAPRSYSLPPLFRLQVVNKTVVRSESSVKSKVVTELEPGATIVVLEETQRDGHHRARIGNKEWVSLRTAKGSILAIAAATVTAVSAAPVVAAVVAAQPCPTAATTIAAQSFASTVDVEVEQLQQHATPTASAQPAAGSAAMHATTGHLGLPPAAAAPLPLVGSAGQLTNLVAPGLPYTMVANATLRAGPSVSSPAVRQIGPRCEVMIFEQVTCDGHHRGRIGPAEWLSIQTAKGKMLAIPGFVADLQSAAATVVAQPAAVYAAPVMAQPMHVTVVGTSVAAQPVQLAAPAAASVAIVTAAPTAAAPAADAPVPGSTPGR